MTREKALEASRALDNIDGMEMFIDSVEAAIRDAEDFCDMTNIRSLIMPILETELQNRKEALASL